MENNFEVGIVWGVNGTNIIIKMYDISSDFKYFYNGEEYEGVKTGGYLSITRGHIDIVCQIESEEIKDNFSKLLTKEENENILNKERYERFVYAKCIGYFERGTFFTGVKYAPVIYNTVKMMSKNLVELMLTPQKKDNKIPFIIGKDIKYGINMDLPWNKIFNTHIGIFGNTGSGKSNTLTMLYKTLLNHEELNLDNSEFVFIDFNGEYVGDKVFNENKEILKLNTNKEEDKFSLNEKNFWSEEVLGILFHSTEKTQKPFLKNMIEGREQFLKEEESINTNILKYIKSMFKKILQTTNPKKEMLELLKDVLKIGNINIDFKLLKRIEWFNSNSCFRVQLDLNIPLENKIKADYNIATNFLYSQNINAYIELFNIDRLNFAEETVLDSFDELEIRVRLDLIRGLLVNYVQYDNINPLISRIKSISKSLRKIMKIVSETEDNGKKVKVISLRNCNQEIKKLFPILLAREYFEAHKNKTRAEVRNTFHLIIDEAHNILSYQSNREAEIWKDYRLELFEEIIKEGRKFGFFLTVSSQRPADISETIMSQFHNFFIHRLINEKDLRLIDNVISTLDNYSKGLIPTLPQGACILTGTAFDFPQIIQVEKIEDKDERPNSDDINLVELWSKK
ncbi:ATP-binding protein [Fusobacterium sp.]|uniref:ATP-binding protein n=1 Tax=Fusobacterium sp. TaxID=68766 RepID=UPI0025C30B60|nr:ATP-binding protein [Fusobacterium sp.]